MVTLKTNSILPGQQKSLQLIELVLGPLHSFPPHEGFGLSHILVEICVPPPHVLLRGPLLHGLHPPSTA